MPERTLEIITESARNTLGMNIEIHRVRYWGETIGEFRDKGNAELFMKAFKENMESKSKPQES